MKKQALLSLFFCFLFACQSSNDIYMFTSFREPGTDGLHLLYSYDGYQWKELSGSFLKPTVGEGKLMRDPSIAQGPDGTYHLVWTTAWRGDQGFGYAHSKDLIHWSAQKFIPVMQEEPETINVWAPEIFYDRHQKQFIILWASTIPFRFPKGVEEEKNNHRMYYTTTTDFNTFSRAKLFLDPGFSVIDAVIAERDQDDYVLVLKDNTRPERNLKVAFSESLSGPYQNVSEPFTDHFTEGPTLLKKEDHWLIFFDAYEDKTYNAVSTEDFKTFEDISQQVDFPEGHKHGTIFPSSEKILEDLIKESEERTSPTATHLQKDIKP